ncbi:hypothetical protein RR48_04856 [Papilio machaon]|uniref:Uncharacterized protein n=1 Tax=Papilio machaon TaxID=76193 RepID=A0A0N1PHQ2_PAPMA|nr:hypothetical protein RR48_04856 [Papilio machaon]
MNPLKRSKVYEKFSKQLLSFRPDTKRPALNIDLNESRRYKEKKTSAKLGYIESIIRNSQEHTTEFNPFVDNTPENFMQSLLLDDILKIEHYNEDDKIAKEEIKILDSNVDEKFISDVVLNNISSEQKEQANRIFKHPKGGLKRTDENKSDNNNVVVLR